MNGIKPQWNRNLKNPQKPLTLFWTLRFDNSCLQESTSGRQVAGIFIKFCYQLLENIEIYLVRKIIWWRKLNDNLI